MLEHFLKVCDAVAYAHNRRVIHRELKAELEPISERRIPPELKAIIARATQLEPARRYAPVKGYGRGYPPLQAREQALFPLLNRRGNLLPRLPAHLSCPPD